VHALLVLVVSVLLLVDLLEAKNILCEGVRSNILGQRNLYVLLANQLEQRSLELLDVHGFALVVQELREFILADRVVRAAIRLDQSGECLLNVVLANTVHGSVVDEQSDESVEGDVGRSHSHLSELTVLNLVDDVLHLLLGWVVAHSAHQVRQFVDGDLLIFKFTGLSSVFFFGTDYTVVEEVIHVLESLTLAATLDKVNERFDSFTAHCDCLLDGCNIHFPHVDSQVAATAGEDVLTIVGAADVGDLIGVSDKTHSLVGVAIHWQLDQTDDLLVCAVAQVLAGWLGSYVQQLELNDLTTVGWSKGRAARVAKLGVPQLHLVLVISGQNETLVEVDAGVPDQSGWARFLLDWEVHFDGERGAQLSLLNIVLEALAVSTDTEKTDLDLVVLVNGLAEAEASDADFVRANLTIELPLRLEICAVLALERVLLEKTNGVLDIRGRKVHTVLANNKVLHSWLLIVTDSEFLRLFLVLGSDGVNNTDLTVLLTDQELSTIRGEFHNSENFVVIASVLVLAISWLVVSRVFFELVGDFSLFLVVP